MLYVPVIFSLGDILNLYDFLGAEQTIFKGIVKNED